MLIAVISLVSSMSHSLQADAKQGIVGGRVRPCGEAMMLSSSLL